MQQILLVDDDQELGELLIRLFERNAIRVQQVTTIEAARVQFTRTKFDALILDLMLPDGGGLDYCRELRASHSSIPIVILSARGETFDRVLGLEIGADDYLAKPFDGAELVARVRVGLRRDLQRSLHEAAVDNRRVFGNLEIDLLARLITINKEALDLRKH